MYNVFFHTFEIVACCLGFIVCPNVNLVCSAWLGSVWEGVGIIDLELVWVGCFWFSLDVGSFFVLLLFLLFLHFGILGCSFVVPLKKGSSVPCCWSFW